MNCLVTAGPTYEPLDRVRRLTNFSTGRLGSQLAAALVARGHSVTLLLGETATWAGPFTATHLERFGTTADLQAGFERHAGSAIEAVFHAAAVSDFACGAIWARTTTGTLCAVHSGKFSTRGGPFLVELVPTPKLIARLRAWYPKAWLVGWKYEVEGERSDALAQAEAQLRAGYTDACVANGPAYGPGFGLIRAQGGTTHLEEATTLYAALAEGMEAARATKVSNLKSQI